MGDLFQPRPYQDLEQALLGVPVVGAAETNPARIHEVSIPEFPSWLSG